MYYKFGFLDDLVAAGKTFAYFCFFFLDSRAQALLNPTNELLKKEYSMFQSSLAKA